MTFKSKPGAIKAKHADFVANIFNCVYHFTDDMVIKFWVRENSYLVPIGVCHFDIKTKAKIFFQRSTFFEKAKSSGNKIWKIVKIQFLTPQPTCYTFFRNKSKSTLYLMSGPNLEYISVRTKSSRVRTLTPPYIIFWYIWAA